MKTNRSKPIKIKAETVPSSNSPVVIGQFDGKCCDANVMNNNDMHLGEQLFENLFASDEYKRAMKNRYYIGYLGHPEQIDCMDFKDACIVMTECHLEDNGDVVGTFDLIDTPVGRTVKAFIDAGVKFGISIRGAGDVDGNGEVDPETFIFRGFDLVTFPAYDDCVPEFREIAASTDINKKAKYKKVCAAISAELKNINSCGALEVIRDQFAPESDEFSLVNDRIDELNAEPVIEVEDITDEAVEKEVLEEKVDALTVLYADAQNTISELEEELVTVSNDKDAEILEAKTKLNHYKRVVANQLADATASYNEEVEANTQLTFELRDVKARLRGAQKQIRAAQESNLKYQRKIEAHSSILSSKDSAIEKVKSQLHETVVAKTKLESKVRDLDSENSELRSRVEAAEQMLLEYQKAYANIYANALGRHISNLTVDSATSVKDLQNMICSSTNTGNISAAPSVIEDEEFVEGDDFLDTESVNDEELEGYDAGLVSI